MVMEYSLEENPGPARSNSKCPISGSPNKSGWVIYHPLDLINSHFQPEQIAFSTWQMSVGF